MNRKGGGGGPNGFGPCLLNVNKLHEAPNQVLKRKSLGDKRPPSHLLHDMINIFAFLAIVKSFFCELCLPKKNYIYYIIYIYYFM